jgi:hypothetical protein
VVVVVVARRPADDHGALFPSATMTATHAKQTRAITSQMWSVHHSARPTPPRAIVRHTTMYDTISREVMSSF